MFQREVSSVSLVLKEQLTCLLVTTMAVSIAGLRRNIKNVAHNYTDAQVSFDLILHYGKL